MNLARQSLEEGKGYEFIEKLVKRFTSQGLTKLDAMTQISELLRVFMQEDQETARAMRIHFDDWCDKNKDTLLDP